MTKNYYDKGDLVECAVEFTDRAGALVDPATVTFKLKGPDNQVTSGTRTHSTGNTTGDHTVVRDSQGKYHVDVNVTLEGPYYRRWEATGVNQAADEGEFHVRPSQF